MDAGWSWSPSRPLANLDPNKTNAISGNKKAAGTKKNATVIPGDENAVPKGKRANKTAAPPKTTAASKKRKSDAVDDGKVDLFPTDVPEIDDDDPRLEFITDTCNAMRKKIRTWIESGAMKVGEFQAAIGVSSKSYLSFMNRTGTWDGQGCDTYHKAHVFFKKRELQGLPLKAGGAKKAKTSARGKDAKDLLDVSGISLDFEDEGTVPIYDTCDEIRKKIRAFLAKDGITQAAFLREIAKGLPDDRKVSAASLRYFLGQKGPRSGNTGAVFYAAYVFFEKRRIKDGKPKTNFREEMEEVHGWQGMDTKHGANTAYICLAGSQPYVDRYGMVSIY